MDVGIIKPIKSIFETLCREADQIWAEAVMAYRLGEDLYLKGSVEKLARKAQQSHEEVSEKEGVIREFIAMPLPENWNERTISQRRMHINGDFGKADTKQCEYRKYVCAAEIWCECFGRELTQMRKSDSREINEILTGLEGLEKMKTPHNFPVYGKQRGYKVDATFSKTTFCKNYKAGNVAENVEQNVTEETLKN